ncbi:hypothetical protein M422DRAFT_262642 [Sphaerobolus stellatus SS14]|uniref:Unplaced genomic scaffold SPHSTscaffold_117, whole genome shotgun sequence n=1 Tax=Sphaerobolus stellatus (strain SS14) TaxID=990650 RepID=A0A0C9VC30_SPHS4|nr:hypothetical protein M422DRAFT_262642 [Sphaerobolus stellatus SS14]
MSELGPNHNINNSTTNRAAANQNAPPCTSSRTSPSLSPRHPFSQTLQSQSTGTSLLSLAPDRIYTMVVVAVMLILQHQVAAYKFGCRRSILEIPPTGFTKQAENGYLTICEIYGDLLHRNNAEDVDMQCP